jgi:hypothetical protein
VVASAVTKRILAAFEAGELISICAWCSLVELDGEWVPASRSDLWAIDVRYTVSGSICPACALTWDLAPKRAAASVVRLPVKPLPHAA